jgi:Dehydrogenases with different specificities (related to short-chain alcohol dehydrogenases)
MNIRRTALITGAASGIGREIAQQFSNLECTLILLDRNENVEETALELRREGCDAYSYTVDLTIEREILAMVEEVKSRFAGCSMLVNCAGVAPKVAGGPVPLEDINTEAWEQVLKVNLTAPFILCREFLPGMKSRRFGRVVNVASVAGRTFRPRASIDYAASKAGLVGLTRRLAGEFAPYGITINCVAPGRVHTPMSGISSAESLSIAQASIPMGRSGTVQEVASTVRFLTSDEASFITGACIDVNGGDFIG